MHTHESVCVKSVHKPFHIDEDFKVCLHPCASIKQSYTQLHRRQKYACVAKQSYKLKLGSTDLSLVLFERLLLKKLYRLKFLKMIYEQYFM